MNQDGKLDPVAVNGYGEWGMSVPLGNGDGTFQEPQTFAYSSPYAALAVGDFNGDGYLDLAAVDGASLSIFGEWPRAFSCTGSIISLGSYRSYLTLRSPTAGALR